MKTFLCLLLISASLYSGWQPDFTTAKQKAKASDELILLNFSGSDWCGPCMQMRKELLDSKIFSAFADSGLVLLNADFPRSKKNQLEKNKKTDNEMLADKYNPEGKFPYTLLLDSEGKIIKAWDGLPDEDAAAFTQEIKTICDKHK